MKTIIYTTGFLLTLFAAKFSPAQQPPYSFEWGKRIVENHPEKLVQHVDEPNDHPNQSLPQLFNADSPTLNAIIPDFQVNDYTGTDGGFQRDPAISTDADGNFVITWVDGRNGDSDIYAKRYSNDGSELGTKFRVNNDLGSYDQDFPSVSSDNNGNFLIIWWELHSDDGRDICAQRYAHDGTVLGDNFRVNDVEGTALQYSQSTFIDFNGNFVIAWTDRRNGSGIFDIYAQRYSNDGSAIGSNFKVNDVQGVDTLPSISISADGNGNFVIAWDYFHNGNYDIYAKRYARDGNPIGTNFRVNDEESGHQYSPSIATDSSGNFVITWTDGGNWNGNWDVYAQRYSNAGAALGTNFRINVEQGQTSYSGPSIFTDNSGNFIITWQNDNGKEKIEGVPLYDIYAQRFSSDGSALGAPFKLDFNFESVARLFYYEFWISITADDNGNFMIAWLDSRNGIYDIYAQRNSSEGALLGTPFKVNDNVGSLEHYYPCLSTDNSGNFIVIWIDQRNWDFDLYAQRYSRDGTKRGTNFRVNDEQGNIGITGFGSPSAASMCTDDNGNFLVAWAGWYGIYAQRYSFDGSAVGINFKVNDQAYGWTPSISVDGSGNFVIAWPGARNGVSWDIYAQRYSSDGKAMGDNFKVNDDNDDNAGVDQWDPVISSDSNGNFVIAWFDRRNGNSDIYAQRYSGDGTALGDNFKVNDDKGDAGQYDPSVSTDSDGDFVVAWEDDRNGDSDIYAQRYSSDGTAMGDNFKVNDDKGDADPHGGLSVSTDSDGNFVVTWEDGRNGDSDIYAQRYLSDGTTLGENFRVTDTGDKSQSSPDVTLWNGLIYTTWVDNRAGGTGYDIWANVLDWEFPITGIKNQDQSLAPSQYMLSQNYPNPFNPTTTIAYNLHRPGKVKLTIYNKLGMEVVELANDFQVAGSYSVIFDAHHLPCGIYMYQLQINGELSEMKKMVLLK